MIGTLAVDVGKGACRARWSHDGQHETFGVGPGVPHISKPGALEAIAEAIVAAAVAAGSPPGGVGSVCAGVTGLLEAGHLASRLGRHLLDMLPARSAIVTGDVVTSHVGAFDGSSGVVVAAGTGSVALGVDPSGRHAKVDGQGYILGDQGSGFAVGRRGLASAIRFYDGRGGSAVLASLAERDFGPLDRLAGEIYASDNLPVTVASFAPAVAEAARGGDGDAVAIWSHVGDELAATATAARDRLGWTDGEVPLSWTGSLFIAGDVLWEPFVESIAVRAPNMTLQPPRGNSLSGAARLARLDGSGLHRPLLVIEQRDEVTP